jgi:hypothetical protein
MILNCQRIIKATKKERKKNIHVRSMVASADWNKVRLRVMVFNATFNNISVIMRQSVLLVEETGICRENHRPVVSH